MEALPVALGILKECLLLSTNEMLPLAYLNANGERVYSIEEASRAEVQYHDYWYSFPLDQMDRFTVH